MRFPHVQNRARALEDKVSRLYVHCFKTRRASCANFGFEARLAGTSMWEVSNKLAAGTSFVINPLRRAVADSLVMHC